MTDFRLESTRVLLGAIESLRRGDLMDFDSELSVLASNWDEPVLTLILAIETLLEIYKEREGDLWLGSLLALEEEIHARFGAPLRVPKGLIMAVAGGLDFEEFDPVFVEMPKGQFVSIACLVVEHITDRWSSDGRRTLLLRSERRESE